jgi:hypothetical protein
MVVVVVVVAVIPRLLPLFIIYYVLRNYLRNLVEPPPPDNDKTIIKITQITHENTLPPTPNNLFESVPNSPTETGINCCMDSGSFDLKFESNFSERDPGGYEGVDRPPSPLPILQLALIAESAIL